MAGAGWLQVNLTLPFRAFSTLLLVLIALALLLPARKRMRQGFAVALASLVALDIVATPLAQWLVVRPQEIDLQAPYLSDAIQATRWGFQLDLIKSRVIEPNAS